MCVYINIYNNSTPNFGRNICETRYLQRALQEADKRKVHIECKKIYENKKKIYVNKQIKIKLSKVL